MTDLETISVYDSKSHEYATMTNSSKPSKHLETFMREVRKGGTVLDLGCGPGNAAAFMSSNGFKSTELSIPYLAKSMIWVFTLILF